jgi:hypothetical protein
VLSQTEASSTHSRALNEDNGKLGHGKLLTIGDLNHNNNNNLCADLYADLSDMCFLRRAFNIVSSQMAHDGESDEDPLHSPQSPHSPHSQKRQRNLVVSVTTSNEAGEWFPSAQETTTNTLGTLKGPRDKHHRQRGRYEPNRICCCTGVAALQSLVQTQLKQVNLITITMRYQAKKPVNLAILHANCSTVSPLPIDPARWNRKGPSHER